MHLASHTDPLYRAMAELARKEAGPKVYAFCSGCHSPAGVLTGLIPAKPDAAIAGRSQSRGDLRRLPPDLGPDGRYGPLERAGQRLVHDPTRNGQVRQLRQYRREPFPFRGEEGLLRQLRIVRQLSHGHSADERVSYRGHVRRVEGRDFFPEGDSVPGLPHAHGRRGPESGGDASAGGSHGKIRCRMGRIVRSIGTTLLAAMRTPTSLPVERPTRKWPRRD